MNRYTRFFVAALGAFAVGASAAGTSAEVLSHPGGHHEPPRNGWILVAEFVLSMGAVGVGTHNAVMAQRRNRSWGWSLVGFALGAGAVAIATDERTVAPGFDIAAGAFAATAAIIRVCRGTAESPRETSTRGWRFQGVARDEPDSLT